MKTWEYLSVTIDDAGCYKTDNHETAHDERSPFAIWADMNCLGNDGWELVNFVHLGGSEGWAIFKRECIPFPR